MKIYKKKHTILVGKFKELYPNCDEKFVKSEIVNKPWEYFPEETWKKTQQKRTRNCPGEVYKPSL